MSAGASSIQPYPSTPLPNLPTPAVTGTWVVYDYDHGPYVVSLHATPEAAARGLTRAGCGRIAFLAHDLELREAIEAWEADARA